MGAFAIFRNKLRAIERFYNVAAGSFTEIKRKIESGEAPFEPPPFDPEYDALEPPFTSEWIEADDFENVAGQTSVALLHSALKDYLDGLLDQDGLTKTANQYFSDRRNKVNNEGWLHRYLAFYADVYKVDWSRSPVSPEQIEEINLARNDVQHGKTGLGLSRYRTERHKSKFPTGIFTSELERRYPTFDGEVSVTKQSFEEAVRRVEQFCEFVEKSSVG